MQNRQMFVTTAGHSLHLGAERVALGLPIVVGFNIMPMHSHHGTGALPARYCVSAGKESSGWHGRQAASLEKQGMLFSPAFTLSRHCCSNGFASDHHSRSHHSSSVLSTAAHAAAVADPASSSSASSKQREQLERQYNMQMPWLGAQLDVAGFTKKGYIRGGAKEQNQDRGLIMQHFRSPGELLLGVMDGHGTFGHLVSTYLLQHLPAVLMHRIVAAAAAAAVTTDSSSSLHHQHKEQGKNNPKHPKHKQQQQQQQQQQHSLPELAGKQLPFVVIPDHGDHSAHSSSTSSSSSYVDPAHQFGGSRQGRAVAKHRLVPQPEHALSNIGSSGSSGSSSATDGAHAAVPSSFVNAVPLTPGLMTAVFAETDHMLSGSGINVLDSGSTGLLCHISHDSVTTAWVGDSRAVLGRRKPGSSGSSSGSRFGQSQWQQQQWAGSSRGSSQWQVVQLSDDHKPERPDEQLRILLNEGRVEQIRNPEGHGVGPFRVWFKQLNYPGLAMSRAFGDQPCRRIGVTVEPELYVHRLSDDDQLLVAATDGVWEYMSNEEVVELAGNASSAEAAARKLVETAEQRWQQVERGSYIDDITAVVVKATPRKLTSKL